MTYLLFPETGSWPSDGGVFNGNGDDREGGLEGKREGGRGVKEKSSDRRWEKGLRGVWTPRADPHPLSGPSLYHHGNLIDTASRLISVQPSGKWESYRVTEAGMS